MSDPATLAKLAIQLGNAPKDAAPSPLANTVRSIVAHSQQLPTGLTSFQPVTALSKDVDSKTDITAPPFDDPHPNIDLQVNFRVHVGRPNATSSTAPSSTEFAATNFEPISKGRDPERTATSAINNHHNGAPFDPAPSPHGLPPFQARPLPSLLRYVDNHLMQNAHVHNQPPEPYAQCVVCHFPLNGAPIKTTVLPLSPCGHWIHYRCFIFHTTRLKYGRDKCPTCGVPLFVWEGICMTTLAARTDVDIEGGNLTHRYRDHDTGIVCRTDKEEYESDCMFIEKAIIRLYAAEMARLTAKYANSGAQTSKSSTLPFTREDSSDATSTRRSHPDPADNSPNLIELFYALSGEMQRHGRPKSAWLKYSTDVGNLLFGMLLSIKLRRHVVETSSWIYETQGWKEFEEGRKILMNNVLAEVREWSQPALSHFTMRSSAG